MKKNYQLACLSVIYLLLLDPLSAQRIRKSHGEMTPSEKTAYLNAVKILRDNGTVTDLANMHSMHFSMDIHSVSSTGSQFLPWHRLFSFQMENLIKNAGTTNAANVCIPYWDWRIENTNANVTWDDAGFLSLADINTGSFSISRSLGTSGTLATQANITSLLGLATILPSPPVNGGVSATSTTFSKRLEHWHNQGHVFIGGTMNSGTSPRDPAFFLHHSFVDKLWQDWEDKENTVKSAFPAPLDPDVYAEWPSIAQNNIVDSRYMQYQDGPGTSITTEDVWYAYNKKLVLDGLNGVFNVTGSNKLYCYTAWNGSTVDGEIFAGDLQRDASDNIIADTKGGFTVKNGAICTFSAGAGIAMLPGFESETGSVLSASIVTMPCGFNSLRNANMTTDVAGIMSLESGNQLQVYHEPSSNRLTVKYEITSDSKVILQVYNTVGQLLTAVAINRQVAGKYRSELNLPDLPQGIYYCRLVSDKDRKTVKFVYQR